MDLRFLLPALVVPLFAGAMQAQEPAQKLGPPPADLPGHVNYLAKQLYGVPLDESAPLTGQIQNLVLDHIQQWLTEHTASEEPSDVDVRRELERVFAQIQYPVYAWPAVFTRRWQGATLYGVGYTLGWSDYDRANVIGLMESRQKQVRQLAVAHFVPHTDLHYAFLTAPAGTAPATGGNSPAGPGHPAGPGRPAGEDFWFLVYGNRLGKSQRRLTAVLYSFDGKSLKALWQNQDAYDGRITIGPNWVSIRYIQEDEYVRETARGRKPPRYESTYKATAKGLELDSTRVIAF